MSVYESILKGLNEAIEYEKGNVQARTAKCTVSPVRKKSRTSVSALG